jgi:ornithine cyclodeaminase/alanine dehydrogenase-like protein (mu-crystallin family)
MSLTSYDPNLSKVASSAPPKLVSFKSIEAVLLSLLKAPDKIFLSQQRAFALATRESKDQGLTSSLPIQTAGQMPQPSLKSGKGAQLCIKTGYVKDGDVMVSKVAAGGGSASNTGAVFVFDQSSLRLSTILCDEGLLTEVRTAAACVYASKLALGREQLKDVSKIGIVGGGVQAVWQLRFLATIITQSRKVVVKTRSKESADAFIQRMKSSTYLPDREWEFEHYDHSGEKFTGCQLIHTLTPSREPVLMEDDINTSNDTFLHITAVGADSPGKCELDTGLIRKANMLLCDSADQSQERGEFQNPEFASSLVEIGTMSEEKMKAMKASFTIFDSSGLAFQDVEIANLVSSMLDQ